jgi:hypothetical protein
MQQANLLSLGQLNALSRADAVELFLTLDAPTEWHGEFDGYTADYLAESFTVHSESSGGLGRWLGKGFVRTPDRDGGHGYNIWSVNGQHQRRQRFAWEHADSMLDGRACVRMRYAAFDNVYGRLDLIDEIRRYGHDIYLAIATTAEPSMLAPEPGGPDGRALPTTFVLRGPRRECGGPDDPAGELLVD